MKTYTITQLLAMAREQGYKMAALENLNGERVVSYNPLKTKIDAQLKTIFTRLKSDVNPDGVYNVLMAHSIAKTKTPDRYAIKKGNVKEEQLAEAAVKAAQPVTIIKEQPQVLTWDKALEYQQKIADLTTKNAQLEYENSQLQAQLEEMEEEEEEGLSAPGQKSDFLKFMGEALPSVMPLADRYFDLEERKLNLRELELTGANKKPLNATKRRIDKVILPGSQEHLNIIEHYFTAGNDDRLQAELDKLERANPTLHNQVCEKLGIEFEEEEGGEDEK